jgi:hypothetical protein
MSNDLQPTTRKRSRLITAFTIIHAILGLIFVGGIVNLSIVIAQEKDDPDAVRGILIGMAACGVFAFVSVTTALGFWLQARWARGLAIANLAIVTIGLAIGFYDDGGWEWDDLPFLVVFAALLVLHLLPTVKRRLRAESIRNDSIEVL